MPKHGGRLHQSSHPLPSVPSLLAVGVSRPTVTQWLDRYEAGGVEELLEDRPRSGRPRKITPDDEAEIVRKTLEEKPADATHWSCRLMAKEVGVHPTTISRIWRAHGLQPHRIEYFRAVH